MLRELLALVVDGARRTRRSFWARLQRVLALPVPGQICGGGQKNKSGGEREQRGESCPRNAAETSFVDATLVCRIVGFRRWVVTNDMRRTHRQSARMEFGSFGAGESRLSRRFGRPNK
jgi:hypothetical protein